MAGINSGKEKDFPMRDAVGCNPKYFLLFAGGWFIEASFFVANSTVQYTRVRTLISRSTNSGPWILRQAT